VRILYHHRTQAEDGQAVHIRALQRAFEQLGHEVFEVSLVKRRDAGSRGRAAPPSRPPAWRAVTKLPRFARELAEYAYTSVGRPRIVAAAREHKVDFVYERYAFGNAAGVMAARRLKLPLILEVNSPMVMELSTTRGLSFPRTAARLENWIFASADRVCVVTEALGEILVGLGVPRERLLVTQNGVELERYEHPDLPRARALARQALGLGPERAGEVWLGFVGYYRDWHRLDLVLDALASPQLAPARLAIVGEGPAHEALVAQCARLGLGERVHFCGARSHDEIPRVLPAFDIALVPAINPYASPLKLFEYMAAGLPAVAPDQPNLREVLVDGDNALLVPPGDGAELQRALARLVADAALRSRLGARAKATIVERDFTWIGNARRVVEAARELGAGRLGADKHGGKHGGQHRAGGADRRTS
jgi:glycosyltransferase involved in cell wall biosynthesis